MMKTMKVVTEMVALVVVDYLMRGMMIVVRMKPLVATRGSLDRGAPRFACCFGVQDYVSAFDDQG